MTAERSQPPVAMSPSKNIQGPDGPLEQRASKDRLRTGRPRRRRVEPRLSADADIRSADAGIAGAGGMLAFLAEGTAGAVGQEFFHRLVEHLALAFRADVGFVAEVVPEDRGRARFLACWEGGKLIDAGDYAMAGTPCAELGGADVVSYEQGVLERFPEDEMVVQLGLDSYLAVTLRGADGTHLGHLGVLAAAPLYPDDANVAAMRIFAARAAAEVERRQHERALRESEARHRELAEELAASRARLVEASDAERRRIERNLHDGAQQRLVTLALSLRLAQSKLEEDPTIGPVLAQASEEVALTLQELRELASGIHPPLLTERGLTPALEALAARAPVPVQLAATPEERLPEPVEATAYYVVAEALTNVAKYARATAATVSVRRDDGRVLVDVGDDGAGGADTSRGSGLRGLADRVEALNGSLRVESPVGSGTLVSAVIPVPAAQ